MVWKVTGAGAPARYPHMPLSGPGGAVSGVAFSPDGSTLAASSQDHKVWLWTLQAASKHRAAGAVPDGALTGAVAPRQRGGVQPGRHVDRGGHLRLERARLEPCDAGGDRQRAPAAAGHVGELGRRRTGWRRLTLTARSRWNPLPDAGPGTRAMPPPVSATARTANPSQSVAAVSSCGTTGSRTLLATRTLDAGTRASATAFSATGIVAAALGRRDGGAARRADAATRPAIRSR